MIEHITEVCTDTLLFVLPLDLLLLYTQGHWTDPNMIVLVSELIIIICTPAFAILRVLIYIDKLKGGKVK